VKGESTIWSVLMSAVGVSFVIVAVALVVVSSRASEGTAMDVLGDSVNALPDTLPQSAIAIDAGSADAAALDDASAPTTASSFADASADAAAPPEPDKVAVPADTTPARPASTIKPGKTKTPTKPKTKKRQ
jgi:hypothetical protein